MNKSMDESGARVAVVGMAGRFPGAPNVDAFWRNLVEGREGIRLFSPEELSAAGVPEEVANDPAYVPAAGIPDDVAGFDLDLFRVHMSEAAVTDPQHRLFLECAWEALEDSGTMTPDGDVRTGVFASTDFNTYLPFVLASRLGQMGPARAFEVEIGNDKDYLATRVSYKLDLKGPSVVVQTACSSSLVAVHLACESLLMGACDVAVAGGSRIHVPLTEGHLHEEGGVSSAEPHCRAFDAAASGTIRGSGVGVVVLKRAEDATSDGDHIYAMVLGSAVNNDGAAKVGFTAPSVEGQKAVICEAVAVAGVRPEEVSYVETHGTGTKLGDPIEVEALGEALRAQGTDRPDCVLGAVKTNVGHLGSAAGVTGLIKAALALDRERIPGTLHFAEPNPELRLEQTGFRISPHAVPWTRAQGRRRVAGVSSFGIGGTNAHVVLAEAPEPEPAPPGDDECQLLVLSAATPTALSTMARNLATRLEEGDQRLVDVALTLQVGRRPLPHRSAVVANSIDDAVARLHQLPGAPVPSGSGTGNGAPKPRPLGLCLLFPGQGAEYAGMAQDARERHPILAENLEVCAKLLRTQLGFDLHTFLDTGQAPAGMARTAVVQPALFALEYCLAQLWMSWGLRPTALVGNSVGEYVAAAVAGVFSMEEGLALTAARGQAMAAMPKGGMIAVRAGEDDVLPVLNDDVSVTAVNAPNATMVAGPAGSIDALEGRLRAASLRFVRLQVEHAFHTPAVDAVLEPFLARLDAVTLNPPRMACYSNLTGRLLSAEDATSPHYWARQTAGTVRFMDCIASVASEGEAFYLEVGPGEALGRFVQQTLGATAAGRVGFTVGRAGAPERQTALGALGSWWQAGGNVAWEQVAPVGRARKVRLPTYPFERQHCWFEGPQAASSPAVQMGGGASTPVATPAVAAPIPATTATSDPDRSADDTGADEPPADRAGAIAGIVAEVTGVDAATVPPDVPFVEQGMESLALLELAEKVRQRFAVRVALADLLEDVSTVESLAQRAGAEASTSPQPPKASKPAAQPDASPGQPVQRPTAAPTPPPSGPGDRQLAVVPFGRRLDNPSLTVDQLAFLERFIPEYARRTATSKAYNDRYRQPHADPRNSAEFRAAWKELVYPIVANRAEGAWIWDLDGNRYVDLTMGFGVALFGHTPKFVKQALARQMDESITVGPQAAFAGDVAESLCRLTGFDRAVFTNSGTEAVMTAIRLARAATRRDRIVIFRGSYHGTFDGVLARAERQGIPRGVPAALGVPRSLVQDVVVLEYGAEESLAFLAEEGETVAAVLVEPVQSRNPALQPVEFLHALRELTRQTGTLLILDEMITGFRCHVGGANSLWHVDADMATYGKVLGGGLAIGAVAGRPSTLDLVDGGDWRYGDDSRPEAEQTFFAGTFCKHPLAMAAAAAVLDELDKRAPDLQDELSMRTAQLATELEEALDKLSCPISLQRFSSLFMFDVSAAGSIAELFFKGLVHRGVYIWEGRTCFLSTAHSEEDMRSVVEAASEAAEDLLASQVLVRSGTPPTARTQRPAAEPVRSANQAPFPWRDEQALLWLGMEMNPEAAAAYNEVLTIPLAGSLDKDLVAQAAHSLVARHDALRLRFDQQQRWQMVDQPSGIPLDIVTIGGDEQRWERGRQAITALRATRFDLENGPMVRFSLLRFRDDEHALVLVAPHLVVDGWSYSVLRRGFEAAYRALAADRGTRWPSAPSFQEFVRWEQDGMAADGGRSIAYWERRLQDVDPGCLLPGDRLDSRTYNARCVRRELRQGTPSRLRSLCSSLAVTPFVIGLATWHAAVSVTTGGADVTIAITFAGQPQVGARDLVGYCVKVLPVRVTVNPDQGLPPLAREVNLTLSDAREHWFTPESLLIERFWAGRPRNRAPMGGLFFELETREKAVTLPEASTIEVDLVERSFTKWDAAMVLVDEGVRMTAELVYNPSALTDDDAVDLVDTYARILESCCEDPATPLRARATQSPDPLSAQRRPVRFQHRRGGASQDQGAGDGTAGAPPPQ
jgi:acyl transferase domain-containing protein